MNSLITNYGDEKPDILLRL